MLVMLWVFLGVVVCAVISSTIAVATIQAAAITTIYAAIIIIDAAAIIAIDGSRMIMAKMTRFAPLPFPKTFFKAPFRQKDTLLQAPKKLFKARFPRSNVMLFIVICIS